MAASAVAKSRASSVVTKEAWGRLAAHTVTCPSGAVVEFRIPDLNALLISDGIPETLRQAVLVAMTGGLAAALSGNGDSGGAPEATPEILEMLRGETDFRRFIVSHGLVAPEMSVDELAAGKVPTEDVDMLADIATRQRYADAKGVWLGVRPLSSFESFLHDFECVEGCPHCAEARARAANGRVGAV